MKHFNALLSIVLLMTPTCLVAQEFSAIPGFEFPHKPDIQHYSNLEDYRVGVEGYRSNWENVLHGVIEPYRAQSDAELSNGMIDHDTYTKNLQNYYKAIDIYHQGINDYKNKYNIYKYAPDKSWSKFTPVIRMIVS